MARRPSRAELEAKRTLERARAEFELTGIPWNGYEVDVELIAALVFELGVQRVSLKIGERQYAGVLDSEGRNIGIEQDHHPHRQRFSVAHEIGHFALHTEPYTPSGLHFCSDQDMTIGREAANSSVQGHKRREWEANVFAATLLMPEDAVLRMFNVVGGSIRRLALHFNVSNEAMEIRLRNADLPFSYRR